MSMILEALSRAEKERQIDAAANADVTKYVTRSNIHADRFKKWILIILLVNFILLVLAGVAWKIYFSAGSARPVDSQTEDMPVLPAREDKRAVDATPEFKAGTEPVLPPTGRPATIGLSSRADLGASSLFEEARVTEKPAKKTVTKPPANNIARLIPPVKYSSQPLTAPQKHISNIDKPALLQNRPMQPGSYPRLTDLPAAKRANLGKYEINVHVYDDNPQNRFVLIDMIKYKEGDRLRGADAQIFLIVPAGVVVDYAGNKILLEHNQ